MSEPEQKKDRTVLIIVAVILILFIIHVIISAAVYMYVTGIMPESHEYSTPSITFVRDDIDNTLTVTSVDASTIFWSRLSIVGQATPPSFGFVSPGDEITDCSGVVEIVYSPTNTVIASFTFTD
jgi:hypothetical protein